MYCNAFFFGGGGRRFNPYQAQAKDVWMGASPSLVIAELIYSTDVSSEGMFEQMRPSWGWEEVPCGNLPTKQHKLLENHFNGRAVGPTSGK